MLFHLFSSCCCFPQRNLYFFFFYFSRGALIIDCWSISRNRSIMEPFLCVTLFFLLLRLRRPGGEIVEEMVETVLYTRLCERERRLSAGCFFFPSVWWMRPFVASLLVGGDHTTHSTPFLLCFCLLFFSPNPRAQTKISCSFPSRCVAGATGDSLLYDAAAIFFINISAPGFEKQKIAC